MRRKAAGGEPLARGILRLGSLAKVVDPLSAGLIVGGVVLVSSIFAFFRRRWRVKDGVNLQQPPKEQAAPQSPPKPSPKVPLKPAVRPEFVQFVTPFGQLKDLAFTCGKKAWEVAKKIAVSVGTFTWFWVKRAAVAAVEFCSRLLKPVCDANAEERLEEALCVHSKVQNLEVAGVLQHLTNSPPRNRNTIPEALVA